RGIRVVKAIDGAMLLLFQAPGAAKIDHANTALQSLRSPLARGLVRSRKEENIDAALAQLLPIERMNAQLSVAENVWIVLRQIGRISRLSRKEQRLGQTRMLAEQAREFKSGVSGRANDR